MKGSQRNTGRKEIERTRTPRHALNKGVKSATKSNDKKKVTFVFEALEANELHLMGDFNRWDVRSLPMRKLKGGIWKKTISLPAGRYEYKLFMDGSWVEDAFGTVEVDRREVQNTPERMMVPNPFGTHNVAFLVE